VPYRQRSNFGKERGEGGLREHGCLIRSCDARRVERLESKSFSLNLAEKGKDQVAMRLAVLLLFLNRIPFCQSGEIVPAGVIKLDDDFLKFMLQC
jgi:hypothetical protein